jgi:hypothetical protein
MAPAKNESPAVRVCGLGIEYVLSVLLPVLATRSDHDAITKASEGSPSWFGSAQR